MKKYYYFIFIIIVSISLIGCNKTVFDGSRTSNDEQFLLEFNVLNDTKTHDIYLEEEDTIAVVIAIVSGRLDITVADIEGKEIYRGNNASSGEFNLIIPKTNTYKITVKGTKAKGSVSFMLTK